MNPGPKPGIGKSGERILAVLRSLGTDKEGRPLSIRTAELVKRSGITANNLPRSTEYLVASGQVIVCRATTPGRGGPTNEYRLGSGLAQPEFRPLETRRKGIAVGGPTKPLPVTTAAPKLAARQDPVSSALGDLSKTVRSASTTTREDVQILQRLQTMTETELVDYLRHLARVWSWGRARALVEKAVAA